MDQGGNYTWQKMENEVRIRRPAKQCQNFEGCRGDPLLNIWISDDSEDDISEGMVGASRVYGGRGGGKPFRERLCGALM